MTINLACFLVSKNPLYLYKMLVTLPHSALLTLVQIPLWFYQKTVLVFEIAFEKIKKVTMKKQLKMMTMRKKNQMRRNHQNPYQKILAMHISWNFSIPILFLRQYYSIYLYSRLCFLDPR